MINTKYLLLVSLLSISATSHANLIFSEYVEGSSSNKALEIFNTGSAVDFDSGGYAVEIYSNGSSTSRYTIKLSGVINQNSAFVIGHNSADSAISTVANLLSGSLTFNGDDAISLTYNGLIIDRIGQIGVDPGSEWGSGLLSTQNNTLRRLPTIITGDINAVDNFDPSLQWLGFDNDVFAGLGDHDVVSPGQSTAQTVQPSVSAPEPASVLLLMLGLLPLLLGWLRSDQPVPLWHEKMC